MQANHTNEIDLDDGQIERLTSLLKLIENAEDATEAVWLPESDRDKVAEIRAEIEDQTGRN